MASTCLSPPLGAYPQNQMKINDLAEVLQLLRRHGYSGFKCFELGLYLGLSPATLNAITLNNKGDIESCLCECLTKWLQKADDVERKGGPTIYSLVSALRELGENRVADGIDMEKHPVCESPPSYTASSQSIVPILVIFLYVAKLIKEKILTLQGEPLLHEIKEAVCNDYRKLEAFAVILSKSTTTDEIRSAIMRECRGNELIELNYNDGKRSNSEYERISIVIDKEANETILKDAKKLSSAIFGNLLQHVKLNVIREGNSFTITCSFPLILSEQLISIAHGNIDNLLEGSQVKRLTIGYYIDDISTPTMGLDEQQFTLLSPSIGLLKQQMDSMTLMKEAESLKELLDTKIKILNESVAESDNFKAELDELKEIKEIFEEQLASFQSEEESKVPAYVVQQFFDSLNVKLPRIASSFNASVTDTKELVSEATEGLKVVRQHYEVRWGLQVKVSYQFLKNAVEAVHTYLNKVNSLYRTLKDQIPGVIEDVESGDVRSTEQLAAEIYGLAQYCKNDYTTLVDCFMKFNTSIDITQMELRRLKEEAEAEMTTRAVIAAGLAAGLAASGVAVGLITFGIGIGVTVKAVREAEELLKTSQSLVVAHGTAVESFDKISRKRFKAHQYELIQNMIDEINQTMKENAKVKRMTDTERTNLILKMRSTLEESIKIYNETSHGLENVERIKMDFTREVDITPFNSYNYMYINDWLFKLQNH